MKEKGNQDIELKWWEKKQGITVAQKKADMERIANKHAKRKAEALEKAKSEKKSDSVAAEKNAEKAGAVKSNKKPRFHKTDRHGNPNVNPRAAKSELVSSLFDPSKVSFDARDIVRDFGIILSKVTPLNSKQRAELPKVIRELSHHLTDERSDRRLGYMNTPTSLSAYAHYFLWWNLVRLTKLFANMDSSFFNLKDGEICLDVGSGPLTVPLALFIARPELREKKLTWYCMDISQGALSLGENIFLTVAAALKCEPWNIVRVKGDFGTSIKEKATLITCANVFNEIVQDSSMPPDYLAKKYCEKILSYADLNGESSKVLVIEPGVPYSARFVSLMRDALMRKDFTPVAPCCHCEECPMDGKKGGKWCNFAFSTEDAPQKLKELSEKADLPKDRAVLSFVAMEKNKSSEQEKSDLKDNEVLIRIASDPIRLPGKRTGYYACSKKGLLLAVTSSKYFSGQCYKIKYPECNLRTDEKSGATIIEVE